SCSAAWTTSVFYQCCRFLIDWCGVTGGHRFGFSQGFIRLLFCFSSALLALFLFISPALGFMVAEFSAFIAFALQPQFSAGRIRITHRLPPDRGSMMPSLNV